MQLQCWPLSRIYKFCVPILCVGRDVILAVQYLFVVRGNVSQCYVAEAFATRDQVPCTVGAPHVVSASAPRDRRAHRAKSVAITNALPRPNKKLRPQSTRAEREHTVRQNSWRCCDYLCCFRCFIDLCVSYLCCLCCCRYDIVVVELILLLSI